VHQVGDQPKLLFCELYTDWPKHVAAMGPGGYMECKSNHRRNCLLQRVIEGKIKGGIEVTGRRERRRRKLLDDLKERRGYSRLKEEALDRAMCRARFGSGFGPVLRQTTK
jgi:hypothetical protein